MNSHWGIHPIESDLGSTQAYYEKMARKGWRLEKAGSTFSRFRRTQPREISCHVLLVNGADSEEIPLDEVQLDTLSKWGWELLCVSGGRCIFEAKKGTEFPKDLLTQEQRKRTSRHLRGYLFTAAVLIFFCAVIAAAAATSSRGSAERFWGQTMIAVVQEPVVTASCLLMIFGIIVTAILDICLSAQLSRDFRRGAPFRRKVHPGGRIPVVMTVCAALIAGAGVLAGFLPPDKLGADAAAYSPYLTLEDLGVCGEAVVSSLGGESGAEYRKSILAEHWNCREFVEANGKEEYLYQNIYRLKFPGMMEKFRDGLMCNTVFGEKPDDFTEIEIEGLDSAFVLENLECVAVRDETVLVMTRPFENRVTAEAALSAAAQKWDKIGWGA